MPDPEEKVSQETKESVTEKTVTDDDLANALTEQRDEEVVVEVEKKVETKKEPTKEELELEEHKERSNLGRRLKKTEDQLAELSQNLSTFLSSQNRTTTQGDDEVPQYISTPEDLEKYERVKARKQQQQKQNYENQYIKVVRGMAGQDEEDGEEVMREVLDINSPFNRYITGDPNVDARLNYAEASRATLKKKTATNKPKPNVKGEKSPVSSQLNVTTRETSPQTETIELDDDAKEFIRLTKMKPESVKAALGK